uniref:Uncharacterized protein n=1 Tax=Tanacetum cinerariifolium TaxID=118510 RepID=A0A699WHD4_TANCI|nr:hypothetical protein [Tanacetum cinerariifolium]
MLYNPPLIYPIYTISTSFSTESTSITTTFAATISSQPPSVAYPPRSPPPPRHTDATPHVSIPTAVQHLYKPPSPLPQPTHHSHLVISAIFTTTSHHMWVHLFLL